VDSTTRGLVALLGLANGIKLGLQLLLALSVWRVLIVRAGDVELGFAGVLLKSASTQATHSLAMQVPVGMLQPE